MTAEKILRSEIRDRVIAKYGSVRKATEKLGRRDETNWSRRFSGSANLTLSDLLDLHELGIDLHECLEVAGILNVSSFLPVLAYLAKSPIDRQPPWIAELTCITDRMKEFICEDKEFEILSFEPSRNFQNLEGIILSDYPKFQTLARDNLKCWLKRNARSHTHNSRTIIGFVEALDLVARANRHKIPLSARLIYLAFQLPLDLECPGVLYLEETACRLIRESLPANVAQQYLDRTISKAVRIDDSRMFHRMLFQQAATCHEAGDPDTAKTLWRKILLDEQLDQVLRTCAAINLATAEAKEENYKSAQHYLDLVPLDSLDHPRLSFNVLWLGGKVRSVLGREGGHAMMIAALHHETQSQETFNLLLLLDDLMETLPMDDFHREATRLTNILVKRDLSEQEREVLLRIVSAVGAGRVPKPLNSETRAILQSRKSGVIRPESIS